jgi:hypothetical protein
MERTTNCTKTKQTNTKLVEFSCDFENGSFVLFRGKHVIAVYEVALIQTETPPNLTNLNFVPM